MRSQFQSALAAVAIALAAVGARADVVFNETVGTPSSNTTITGYTGWSNNGTLTFTGSGFVRMNTFSDYSGASAAGNVLIMNNGTDNFQISGINTSAYVNSFTLSFGAYKAVSADDMTHMALEYSTDGTNYSSLSVPPQSTASGSQGWRVITLSNIALASAANLRLRWTNTGTGGGTGDYRLDDISLSGTPIAVPEAGALLLVALAGGAAAATRQPIRSPSLEGTGPTEHSRQRRLDAGR